MRWGPLDPKAIKVLQVIQGLLALPDLRGPQVFRGIPEAPQGQLGRKDFKEIRVLKEIPVALLEPLVRKVRVGLSEPQVPLAPRDLRVTRAALLGLLVLRGIKDIKEKSVLLDLLDLKVFRVIRAVPLERLAPCRGIFLVCTTTVPTTLTTMLFTTQVDCIFVPEIRIIPVTLLL